MTRQLALRHPKKKPKRKDGLGSSGGAKMHQSILTASNLIQLFIAIIALFSAYIAYWVTRIFIAPNLIIKFDQKDRGLCHKTRNCLYSDDIGCKLDYYFRFYVENTGKSMAKHCEIVAEKLWYKPSEGQKYQQYNQFAPVNLNWTGATNGIININPKRKVAGNIGHIPEKDFQDHLRKRDPHSLIDLTGKERDIKLRFILELVQSFYALPNCLAQGDYCIQIGLYSENAKDKKRYFEIKWNGEWDDEEEKMFKQIKIEEKEKPPIEEESVLIV